MFCRFKVAFMVFDLILISAFTKISAELNLLKRKSPRIRVKWIKSGKFRLTNFEHKSSQSTHSTLFNQFESDIPKNVNFELYSKSKLSKDRKFSSKRL